MSGLILGTKHDGTPFTVQLFRQNPTRIVASLRDYMSWLIVFRAVALGAHVTILTTNPKSWGKLVEVVTSCGGTIEVSGDPAAIPGRGRAYRPSLVIDDLHDEGARLTLGAWQTVISLLDAAAPAASQQLRACDLALISPCEPRVADNLRKALALNPQVLKQAAGLAENELVAVQPRRLERIAMPPTSIEYQLLFTA